MKVSPAQTYHKIRKSEPDFEDIRQRLKVKSLETKDDLAKRFPQIQKVFLESGSFLDDMRTKSSKLMATGALTSALFFSPPVLTNNLPTASELMEKFKIGERIDDLVGNNKLLINYLNNILPEKPKVLTVGQEKALEQGILEITGISAKATLEGEHLNVNYGYIGAEQHLYRFPGDSLSKHGDLNDQKEGIAPGLGAWGYFANSQKSMTPNLYEIEKWYAVVQTLYLPDWNIRQPYLKNWYQYRKVLIINTVNGNVVVASIADSGPAAWTGKHFGGSPEVMDYLGGFRYKKGLVLVLFVDDPENKIPLGPVEYGKVSDVLSFKT